MTLLPKYLKDLFKGKDHYQCRYCGYVLPKEDAVVSGWDAEGSLRHVHCPRRGKIITHTP